MTTAERAAASGLSVFLRDGDTVYRTYFTNGRGVDRLWFDMNIFDLTPLGRQEKWEQSPDEWPLDHARVRPDPEGRTGQAHMTLERARREVVALQPFKGWADGAGHDGVDTAGVGGLGVDQRVEWLGLGSRSTFRRSSAAPTGYR